MTTKTDWEIDREVIGKATPGPWQQSRPPAYSMLTPRIYDSNGSYLADTTHHGNMREDAEFIARSRTRWAAALDRIAELEAKVVLLNAAYNASIEQKTELRNKLASAEKVVEAARRLYVFADDGVDPISQLDACIKDYDKLLVAYDAAMSGSGTEDTAKDGGPLEGMRISTHDGVMYVEILETTLLKHEEHKPISVEPGLYQVDLVREYCYEEHEMRRVID